MENKESIAETKQSFEHSFAENAFYNKQTKDEKHLELILKCLQVKEGMKVLDLGTGTGFLAFPLARNYPGTDVTGLDIVEKALENNRKKAKSEGLNNLQFVNYNGMEFPFPDQSFDLVMTRYALHHVPMIQDTFKEISRVLKPQGIFFLSDPTPNDDDKERFVDAYMQMKKDGHIKFYTKREWLELGDKAGLHFVHGFETRIRFPKKLDTAVGFDDIMNRFEKEVIRGYELEVIKDEIWITEKVNNLSFKKRE